jgi:hypothetical protein
VLLSFCARLCMRCTNDGVFMHDLGVGTRKPLSASQKGTDDVRKRRGDVRSMRKGPCQTNGIMKRHEEVTETLDHYKQLMSNE